jgi:hypothetical protein
MRWEYLWIKIAVATGVEPVVWPVATSKDFGWCSGDVRFSLEANGHFTAGEIEQPTPHEEPLLMQVWGDALDALGREGWELVGLVPLSADARLVSLGHHSDHRPTHDMQVWLFKRALPEQLHAARSDANDR